MTQALPRKTCNRLPVSRCRQLLGKPELSNSEVENIRDTLYGFADVLISSYIEEHQIKRKRDSSEESEDCNNLPNL